MFSSRSGAKSHGFSAERIKHLTVAAGFDPKNVLAQGLMGLVAFQGKMEKPEQVKDEIQSDPKSQALFREYLDRRVRTPQKADAQLRLAAWCLENGLKDEAMAHYHLVTRLDPSRDIAWIRLGYKKNKDRWSEARSPGCAEARIRSPEARRPAMEITARETARSDGKLG